MRKPPNKAPRSPADTFESPPNPPISDVTTDDVGDWTKRLSPLPRSYVLNSPPTTSSSPSPESTVRRKAPSKSPSRSVGKMPPKAPNRLPSSLGSIEAPKLPRRSPSWLRTAKSPKLPMIPPRLNGLFGSVPKRSSGVGTNNWSSNRLPTTRWKFPATCKRFPTESTVCGVPSSNPASNRTPPAASEKFSTLKPL